MYFLESYCNTDHIIFCFSLLLNALAETFCDPIAGHDLEFLTNVINHKLWRLNCVVAQTYTYNPHYFLCPTVTDKATLKAVSAVHM